ncbi:MAG: thiamine pyrophosphate-dependent dehydrogenase E1 component subunit alpha [Proteobacteria bacterium]|nr:thiamine pyrophosphate-dependent dehydrogenase E1 component subunit alpha [Pseudomonadota bacterium]
MRRIRAFEEAAEKASLSGRVGGAVHLSIGQEAIAAGVCANLRRSDQITTTHRGHGHCIAKGTDPGAMMLELFGKQGGTCGGKGGSMHIADFQAGMLGANGVVAAGIPIAVGAAHGAKLLGEDRVVVCFFGDGAINRGPFMEGLNWASVFHLPVLFVCEQNGFASTTHSDAVTAGPGANARAESLGLEAFEVDGNDVAAVDGLVGDLIPRIRGGAGPKFLSAQTYRLKGHTSVDPGHYRDQDYAAAQWEKDPLLRTAADLRRLGVSEAQLALIDKGADAEMKVVTDAAEAADYPALEQAFTDIQDIGAPVWRDQS